MFTEPIFKQPKKEQGVNKFLFVEAAYVPEIIQKLLVLSKLICASSDLTPLICESRVKLPQTVNFANHYLSNFKVIIESPRTIIVLTRCTIKAIFKRIMIAKGRDVLAIKISGYLLGPVIYDSYLGNYTASKINLRDWKLLKTIFQASCSLERAISTLDKVEIGAVLLSHRIGMSGAMYAMVATRKGIPVYSFGGDSRIALNKSLDPLSYVYRPEKIDTLNIINMKNSAIDALFEKAKKHHLTNSPSDDSKSAYSGQIIGSRNDFFKQMKIQSDLTTIVFIAAHIPNDYPNGVGVNSCFVDYHHWLETTLSFAQLSKNIFWVIKEHPMMKNYGFSSEYFSDLEASYQGSNIYFLKYDADFSTESLANIASAVITCNGSIGFEMPALFGIPSIYWSNSTYSDFKVGTEIRSIEEYRDLILNLDAKLATLKLNQQAAKGCYAFVYWISRMDFHINTPISQAAMLRMNSLESFVNNMQNLRNYYMKNHILISEEESEIIEQLRKEDFTSLRSIDYLNELH